MAELIELNVTNMFIVLILTNIIWFWFMNNVKKYIGKTYFDSVVVAIRKGFKAPATFIKFHKAQYYNLEIRDMSLTPSFDKNKKIPIVINEEDCLTHESPLKAYVLVEGLTTNIRPLNPNPKLYDINQRAGVLTNMIIDIERDRLRKEIDNELLTKKHFNIGIALVLIGLIIIGGILYNINTFADMATKQYETYRPFIEQALGNLPRIEPGDFLTTVSNTVQPGSAK